MDGRRRRDGTPELGASVNVVVLDWMIPGLSGREVLDKIRDREADPPVVMVTAVDPETDIVEMPLDAYLPKPIDREALNETVETLLDHRDSDDKLKQYYALVEKRATLEAETPDNVLEDDERFQRPTQRIEGLEDELYGETVRLDREEFVALLDDVV